MTRVLVPAAAERRRKIRYYHAQTPESADAWRESMRLRPMGDAE